MKWSFPDINLPNSFEHPFIEERPSTFYAFLFVV